MGFLVKVVCGIIILVVLSPITLAIYVTFKGLEGLGEFETWLHRRKMAKD